MTARITSPPDATGVPQPPAEDARLEMDRLFSATYEELRRLASSVRREDPSATLNPTALVNEAWLKLAGSSGIAAESRLHFKRIAARAMRQVLVEAARRRNARKRGGPEAAFVTFDEALDGSESTAGSEALIALDAALDRLAQLNPRQARMIECRFFGGLDVAETAELLGVSEATLMRDWRAARAWLAMEIRRTVENERRSLRGAPSQFSAGANRMNADRWARLQDLFHRAADLPEADRRAFVHAECGDDTALAADALAMLEADAGGASLIDGDVALAAREVLGVTSRLSLADFGAYRIREVIGEGGMGVVYRAVREDLGSTAAIKVLRDAWLSPARRERFAAEQRILAQLNHPGIARLYDAGTFADGTPWIVMEFVDGVPITAFCRRNHAGVPECLRLFRAVGAAVQHAHEHAVIHRDIKPSNILITPAGEVKLLDFGIAKQLAEHDETADQTRTGLRLLTPAYAAPEQVRGDPVGLHTDVYSLGVVLYELLTWRLPFDLTRHTPEEAVSIVATHEPERPSVVVRRRPADEPGRESGAAAWSDLDVLCLTAMHKDPQRRYRTVEALIRDVDHYLAGEPLEARPDSVRYRAGKFARRHWRELSAASFVLVVLVALVAFYTMRLATARDVALAEAARTQRVQAFTLNLFRGGDEIVGPADSLRVVTMLQRGEQDALLLDREPEIQADLYATLGEIYQQLGRLEHADSLLRVALDRRRSLGGGAQHAAVAENLVALGLLHLERAQLADGEQVIREALALARRELPVAHPVTARATAALGQALEEKGDYAEAVAVLEEAVRLHWLADSTSPDLTATLRQLGSTHFYAGHFDVADSVNRQVLALTRRQLGERHPLVADDLVNLGATKFERGAYAEAESYYREALAITRPFFGDAHQRTAGNLVMLGRAILYQQRFDEAEPLLREALAIRERVYGPVHPSVASVLNELGNLAISRRQLDEAQSYFRRMASIYRAIHGDRHYMLAVAISNEAGVYVARRDYAGAERLYRDAVAGFAATQGPASLNTGIARIKLGRALLRQERYADAERETLAGYEIVSREAEPTVSFLTAARQDLAMAYDALGRSDAANQFRAEQAAVDSAKRAVD